MSGAASARTLREIAFDHRLEPHVRVHHSGPAGRTRLRLEPLVARLDLLRALARRVAAREGVASVHENPWTGSLLVEHDKRIASEAIAELVREIWRSGLDSARRADDLTEEHWHALAADAAVSVLSRPNGLDWEEARLRLQRIGENRLQEPPRTSMLSLVADQFKSVPVALLGASALLSLATGGVFDALITLGVIGLNASIGVTTQAWTDRLIRRLDRPVDYEAPVLRNGLECRVPLSRVAPGDWLVLRAGVAVAADARLISSNGLSIDESSLTGESAPVEKHAEAALEDATPLGARRTMVYRGAVVTNGAGLAVVTATGAATEIGRVRKLLETTHPPVPPMEAALDRLGVRLTFACLAASGLLALLLGLRGQSFAAIAKSAIALSVSAIPEGLPALAASTKALAARAMAREGAFVRNTNVVETAANIDVLCLDKTGTLTQNRMQAAIVQTADEAVRPDEHTRFSSAIVEIAEIAALCNDADAGLGASSSSGTERALIDLAHTVGVDVEELRRRAPRRGSRPRADGRPFMVTEHAGETGALLAVKGAPGAVLELCSSIRRDGRDDPLRESERALIQNQNEDLSGQGLRVLAIARANAQTLVNADDGALVWLGLVGLSDPLRPEAADAIRTFQGAGLRTIILTGDQAPTARKLAADLGLAQDDGLEVIDAAQMNGLSLEEIAELAMRAEAFARVGPGDKLKIIKALQGAGRVVAMTGDGVNDGPALRAADVGVAMGKSGADVARDVADIIIADDNLNGLARALARGRAADENLRRAVRFLLATNGSEVALLLAEALHGPDALETPAELFWLNLMTDVFPALGLAMAKPPTDILNRAPRSASADVFGAEDIKTMAWDALKIATPAIINHLIATVRFGPGDRTRGLTFLTLASHQLMRALRLRPGRPVSDILDRPVELGVAAGFALLAAAFAARPLQRVLKISPPRPFEAALILGFSFLPVGLALSRRPQGQHERTASGAGAI